jgi:hypothetical protein
MMMSSWLSSRIRPPTDIDFSAAAAPAKKRRGRMVAGTNVSVVGESAENRSMVPTIAAGRNARPGT